MRWRLQDLLAPPPISQRARVGSWILAALLALLFILQGGAKLLSARAEIEAFQRWGYPDWFRYVVGTMEVIAVALVLQPRLRLVAGVWIMGIMVGAILTHLRVGEFSSLPLPVTAMAMAVGLAWIHRPTGLLR